MSVRVAMIAGVAENGVIGVDGRIPWRIPSDMAFFKRTTMGKPIIMGRKTYESLPGGALPGRTNIVLTRDQAFSAPKTVPVDDFSEAVQIAREQAAEDGVDEVFVIGGAEAFALALPRAAKIYLTEVEAEVEGDVVLPPFDESRWREVFREGHPAGERDEYPFTFRVLERGP
jgi:dihydrofolate reductase